eukprot:TRINITY_DN6531_c1_g1_i1.p1 TRINITY_DN6531_c1_g1~~TRINITY_DN6531_c1_g1_i1.p1  ORF type:complete len:111 (-),score=12.88 TRINITY_DN6531_c1_g1_i1:649-981(-)
MGISILHVCLRKRTSGSHRWKKNPKPTDESKLAKWETNDAKIITWILSSVEPHIILSLRCYKTEKDMWEYLKRIYNQENSACKIHLEHEIAEYSQGTKTIQEYYSGFVNP